MGTVDKEGWLIKNGQKRYFVLSNDALTWFSHPMGSTKGSLELRDYFVDIEKKTSGEELVLSPAKDKAKKQYRLTGTSPGDVAAWAAVFEKVIKYRCLKQDENFTKQGWLEKKGKKRWFLLKNEVLYWFNKEQYLNSDFTKNVNGSLELADCAVSGPPTPTSLTLTLTSRVHGSYTLTAKSKLELDEWVTILKQAIEKAVTKKNTRWEGAEENELDKKGYLIKKGQRRFFVLKDGVLTWFLTEKEEKIKGKLILSSCQIQMTNEKKNSFIIQTPYGGKSYELTAKMTQEAEEWLHALTQASQRLPNLKKHQVKMEDLLKSASLKESGSASLGVNPSVLDKRGWLMKKGKRRYFVLRQDILFWFTHEQPKEPQFNLARGNLPLGGALVEKNFNEFSFSIKSSYAKEFTLTAKAVSETKDWVDILQLAIQYANEKSKGENSPRDQSFDELVRRESKETLKKGWLVKKGLSRWFELSDDTLRWYESDTVTADSKVKGSLPLYNCSVSETSKESFIVSSPAGKSYIMQANAVVERDEWIKALQQAILRANQLMECGFEKKGWLEKKGQRRWFVLKQTKLIWFSQQQTFDNVVVDKANNSLDITDCAFAMNSDEVNSFDVEDIKRNIVYTLRAKSNKEAQEWVSALVQARSNRGKSSLNGPKGKVFGIPLEQLQVDPTTQIPIAIQKMTSYLMENGLRTTGIFRLSCSSERRAELKEAFDKDPVTVDLKKDEGEVHVVAALLKGFLRELPEPLIPYNMYTPLLRSTQDRAKVKELLLSLPEINIKVMKHLFGFIRAVSSNSEVNQMNDSNLSIVFGPNILRPADSSMIGGLADTPLILSFILLLASNYDYFFA